MTEMNNMVSTWDIFCKYILEYAAKEADAAIILKDSFAAVDALNDIPKNKILKLTSDDAMILAAAGLAVSGKKTWIISESSAITSTGYGQIREAVAIPSLPVRIVVAETGLCKGQDGVGRNILEDTSLMRALPNMSVFIPSDSRSFEESIAIAENCGTPSYIRLSRTPLPSFSAESDFISAPRGARMLTSGTGVTICACGIMVNQALKAASILEQQGIGAEVIDCYSIKPLPEQILLASVRRTGCCVVAGEQSRIGGLCGAVAESLSTTYPIPVRFVAVDDYFVGSGMPDELREYHGLTWQEIVSAASQVWALRRR